MTWAAGCPCPCLCFRFRILEYAAAGGIPLRSCALDVIDLVLCLLTSVLLAYGPLIRIDVAQTLHLVWRRRAFSCGDHHSFGWIFREGQSADHFYLIHKGKIALETFVPLEGGTTIQTLSAGEALGWSWLFSPYSWHFTARAIEPAELVEFGAADLREKAEENHDFGYDLAMRIGQVMFERLQTSRRRLVKFYTRD